MPLYGFYSIESANQGGTCAYTTPDGKVAEVTEVSRERDGAVWPDAVFVGEVVRCVRMKDSSAMRAFGDVSGSMRQTWIMRDAPPPEPCFRELLEEMGGTDIIVPKVQFYLTGIDISKVFTPRREPPTFFLLTDGGEPKVEDIEVVSQLPDEVLKYILKMGGPTE